MIRNMICSSEVQETREPHIDFKAKHSNITMVKNSPPVNPTGWLNSWWGNSPISKDLYSLVMIRSDELVGDECG